MTAISALRGFSRLRQSLTSDLVSHGSAELRRSCKPFHIAVERYLGRATVRTEKPWFAGTLTATLSIELTLRDFGLHSVSPRTVSNRELPPNSIRKFP
jgi:hypothetical protein